MKALRKLRAMCAQGICGLVFSGLLGALLPAGATGATGPTGATGTGGVPVGVTSPYTTVPPAKPGPNPLSNRSVWIWELPSSDGGNLTKIIARSQASGIKTVMIKSGDGTSMWPQFNSQLVARFHAANMKVCAWQYVYGRAPADEAAVGAQAARDGADCLLIDAEGEYEGKYVSAQTYITSLRRLIGQSFPVALAGLPYIDYHPAFPYSVFLGPGAAQYDMPQMYWYTIGTTVNDVFAHTYGFNRLYQRPIFPLGQVYGSPPITQVLRFRQVSRQYMAPGVSWWDWQEAAPRYFTAISRPIGSLSGAVPAQTYAALGRGAQGDVVIWAQEHLDGAGATLPVDGTYGPRTVAAVAQFQLARGLAATGQLDTATWAALLKIKPVTVKWVIRRKKLVAVTAAARLAAATGRAPLVQAVPPSAHLPDRGHELPQSLGAGPAP